MYYRWKNKDAWVASKRIGERVCDGRGKHLVVTDITYARDFPRWVITLGIWLHGMVLPRWGELAAQKIEHRWLDLAERFRLSEWREDIDFELSDGWTFNGFDSCNEPQHDGSCHKNLES